MLMFGYFSLAIPKHLSSIVASDSHYAAAMAVLLYVCARMREESVLIVAWPSNISSPRRRRLGS